MKLSLVISFFIREKYLLNYYYGHHGQEIPEAMATFDEMQAIVTV